MRLHRIVVWMLVLLLGAAPLTPLPVGAQSGESPSPRVSVKGVPFVTATPAGTLVGAFEIESFTSEGDELRVTGFIDGTVTTPTGLVIVTHEDFPVVAPLKIIQANAESLLLEIGPFPLPGDSTLQQPLQLHVDQGDNVIRRSGFFKIARAVQQGASAAELAALLDNPEGSCDWWMEYIVCPAAFIACGATCVFGPEVCVPCLVGIGLSACIGCFT